MGVSARNSQIVNVWEDRITIPTYTLEEVPYPIFYWTDTCGRWCYPYFLFHEHQGPFQKKDRKYIVLILENKYLKIVILPELGGRIYSAFDKTSGQEMFFRNDVIKPRNIGLEIGAFLACGVELNVPDAHSITTARRREYQIKMNNDGSGSVIIGEIDHIFRLRWHIEIKLNPDKAYIEQTVKIHNRNCFPANMRYWSNASVKATDGLQCIFPERTADQHGQSDFQYFSWPIFAGIDISSWKNVPEVLGLYMTNVREDFFGYYNHDYQMGVVHLADHHVLPGKKYWCWGMSQLGKARAKNFSDNAGPYAEIQAGRPMNQDHFEILPPQKIISWKEYWYPYSKIGAFKHANRKAVVNIEPVGKTNSHAFQVGVSVTEKIEDTRIKVENGNRCLIDEQRTIKPEEPFLRTIQDDALSFESTLTLTVFDKEGGKIIEHTYRKEEPLDSAISGLFREDKGKKPETAEEFCVAGKWCEQQRQLKEAIICYQKALKIDEYFAAANLALGRIVFSQGKLQDAEVYFQKVLRRNNFLGEAYFYLGLILLKKEDTEEAIDSLYSAIQYGYVGLGHHYLGEAYLKKGDYSRALSAFNEALDHDFKNIKTLALKSVTLRKSGHPEVALKIVSEALSADSFDLMLQWEYSRIIFLLKRNRESKDAAARVLNQIHNDAWTYMELAIDYGNIGSYEEAISILEEYSKETSGKNRTNSNNAMVYYLLAYYYDKTKTTNQVRKNLKKASAVERIGVHPNRLEELEALNYAVSVNKFDASALYYRGNFYLSKGNAEQAIKDWEAAISLGDKSWLLYRNIAHVCWKIQDDKEKAHRLYLKAIKIMTEEPNLLEEFCELLDQQKNKDVQIGILEGKKTVLKKSRSLTNRLVQLYINKKRYNDAIRLLENSHFEGWCQWLHLSWEEAHIARGIMHLSRKECEKALKDFQSAMLYPENIGSGPSLGLHITKIGDARILYYLGLAYDGLGKRKEAEITWRKCGEENFISIWDTEGEYALWLTRYYQALALKKMKRTNEAKTYLAGFELYARKSNWNKETKQFLLNLANKGKRNGKIEYVALIEPRVSGLAAWFMK